MAATTRRRRIAQLLALLLLPPILAVAPMPELVQAQEAVIASERAALSPAADRAGVRLPLESADEIDRGRPGLERRSAAREVAEFHAIGVTLTAAPEAPVYVRGRVDGSWTPWLEAHFGPEEGPDRGTEGSVPGLHSQPVWIGHATAYEVDAPAPVTTVDVHLVREVTTERRVAVDVPAAGAVTTPGIATRDRWSARPPKRTPSITGDLKLAIVHHSVNSNSYSGSDVPAMLRAIQAYHMDVNGWDDIGYNFLVDRFGTTWEARAGGIDRVVVGGHSAGFNTASVGVVVLGDFTSAIPPSAALESVARVIAWKFAVHRVSPTSLVDYTTSGSTKHPPGGTLRLPRVIGHRDAQSTSCPGAQLYSRLGSIRARVNELVSHYQQSHTAATLLALDVDGNGLDDALHYRPGSPGDTWWRPTGLGGYEKQATSVNGTFRPVAGDFDGDGRHDVLWHGLGTAADYFWWSRPTGTVSQRVTIDGSFIPSVGDFDGNGVDDIHWYSPGPSRDAVWYFERGGSRVSHAANQDLITAVPLVGDFNGDRRDDVLWYGPGSADDRLWLSAGRGWSVRAIAVSGQYDPAVLDAHGDGVDDVVWVGRGGAPSYRWDFSTSGAYTSRSLPVPGTTGRPHVGDFDGDGRDDVLVYASGAAPDAVWYSSATGATAKAVSISGTYEVATGHMDSALPTSPEDIFFASMTGPDYLWRGRPNRTFTSVQVG